MQALTAIGEVGLEHKGRSYLLRPSLFSMTRIGSPAEIIEATALLLSPEPENAYLLKIFRKQRFERALDVIYACAGDQDLGDLIGGMVPGRGRILYSPGAMPLYAIIALAQGLIRHGVLGDVESTGDGTGEAMQEFKPAEHVAVAIAHLGMSEAEAWNMTMTSFVQVMHSKYPPKKGTTGKAHTAEQYDATMERLKKINAARAGKK